MTERNEIIRVEATPGEIGEGKRIQALEDAKRIRSAFTEDRWTGPVSEIKIIQYVMELGGVRKLTHLSKENSSNTGDIYLLCDSGEWYADNKNTNIDVLEVPKPGYECNVEAGQVAAHGAVNCYTWTRYHVPSGVVFLLGWNPYDEFLRESVFHRKGETLDNGKPCKSDMRSIQIVKMRPLHLISGRRFRCLDPEHYGDPTLIWNDLWMSWPDFLPRCSICDALERQGWRKRHGISQDRGRPGKGRLQIPKLGQVPSLQGFNRMVGDPDREEDPA